MIRLFRSLKMKNWIMKIQSVYMVSAVWKRIFIIPILKFLYNCVIICARPRSIDISNTEWFRYVETFHNNILLGTSAAML